MNLVLSYHLAYEGFLGDPIGGGVRYYLTYDNLTLSFRGGAGVGGMFSYLNLHLIGDATLNVPITEEVSAYMGGGMLTGVRVFGGMDVGLGIKIMLGAEMKVTDDVSLGFEFAPLVVKSFGGKSHPGISFGLRAVYYPELPKDERVVAEEGPGKVEVAPNPPAEEGEEKRKEVSKEEQRGKAPTYTERRTVNRKAAEEEYKRGLQAYANGDLYKAKEHFEKALKYDPTYERARMALEKVKRQLGER